MDKNTKKIYETMRNLFTLVQKLDEESIKKSDYNDLSRTELHALISIGTGRPKTMTHVANILEISVSTLTATVNKLVKKGYVERLRDDKDRRMVKIRLTDDGAKAAKAEEAFRETIVKDAVDQIPVDKIQYFVSAIDNINRFFMTKSSMIYVKNTPFSLSSINLGANKLEIPIVQAAMGMGIAGAGLASAVAAEGGLGLIGTAELGYRYEEYEKDRIAANTEAVRDAVKKAKKRVKALKGSGLIGVGIMWGESDSHKYVETAVKAGAQVIVTAGSLPRDLPKYCNDKKIALIPTVSSKRAASAIIRTWSKKYNRVPDGFILQGPFAAGMLGFKEEQLDRAEQEWYRIIADMKSELLKLENCPLIVGGGIFSREDAEIAYKYGADGFLMGTRFLITEECDAPEEYKNLYLNCTKNDVTIIRSHKKTSVRVMKNKCAEELSYGWADDYDMFGAVRKGVEGDYERGLIFCSSEMDRADRICKVKDVFKEFITETGGDI